MYDFRTPEYCQYPSVVSQVLKEHTALLVYAQRGNSCTRAPRRQFRNVVHERLQRIILLPQREHDAQMLRDPTQPLDILLDQLRGTVVVEEDGQDTVDDGTVALHQTDVDAEEDVDERVDQQVDLRLDERPDGRRLLGLSSGRLLTPDGRWPTQRGRVGQVGSQDVFAVRRGERCSAGAHILSVELGVSGRDHAAAERMGRGMWEKRDVEADAVKSSTP